MRAFFRYDGVRHWTYKQGSILRKKRLNGRLRPPTNPADFRRDLFDNGCEDGCARVEGVGAAAAMARPLAKSGICRSAPVGRGVTPRGLLGSNARSHSLRTREYSDPNLSLPIR